MVEKNATEVKDNIDRAGVFSCFFNRDGNPSKSSNSLELGAQMSNLPVDRDKNYMYQMWGTTNLVTDYTTNFNKRTLQEIMHDDVPKNRHFLKEQTEIHETIRNDDDYDDWEYGTEPTYGKPQ